MLVMFMHLGGVAQLEEHLTGSQEVVGSSPIASTDRIAVQRPKSQGSASSSNFFPYKIPTNE